MDTFVKYHGPKPKLRNPIMIEGLPGYGQVGRLVAEHLVKELKGKKFAELYSAHFPPQVMIKPDGLVDMITNNFFAITGKGQRDIIIVIGEAQAATVTGQYEICNKILDVAEEFKVKDIITIGGYATGRLLKEPRVYGAATNKDIIKEFEKHQVSFQSAPGEIRGGIIGISGLLVGMSHLRDINAVCLMGETPGHPLLIDAKAAEAIIKVLSKHLKMDIQLGELDKHAKELEKFRLGLEKMMRRLAQQEVQKEKELAEKEEEKVKYIG